MNVRVLTEQEVKQIANSYKIFYENGKAVVIGKIRLKRRTIHSMKDSFRINMKKYGYFIRFTQEAFAIWKEFGYEENLIYIQYAINILKTTYQDITKENVQQIIEKVK